MSSHREPTATLLPGNRLAKILSGMDRKAFAEHVQNAEREVERIAPILSESIEGDVQFAAEVSWLVDNVRWDAEEDLARLIGDAPAHTLAEGGRAVAQALRQLASRLPGMGQA